MSTPPRTVWERLTLDPRDPGNATMRASDKDRDVVLSVLSEAYAEGRLDREELDDRTTQVQATKRLGDLVAPLTDLTATDAPARPAARPRVPSGAPTSGAVAQIHHRDLGRVLTFLVPTLVCWAVWVATCFGPQGFDPYFPWPVFVTLGTARMAFGAHPCRSHPGRRHHDLDRELQAELRAERRPGGR